MRRIASRALACAAAGGCAYLAIALWRVRRFSCEVSRRDERVPDAGTTGTRARFEPGVSVLKPLHGLEPGLAENLATFLDQEYPVYQVVFCATSRDDPAVPIAAAAMGRFPGVDAEVVVRAARDVANPKIANILNAVGLAKHDVLVVADADIRVERSYLRRVVAPFEDVAVGAVTALYGALPADGLVSTLAAMHVNDHFAPSVLVAQMVEPLRYCFGSTMAVRREVLDEIGGFAALGSTIADDHRLGELVCSAGCRVALARCVVRTVVGDASLGDVWRRELRWARTIRSVRPLGSTLAVVTLALPLALLAWAAAPRSPRRRALLGVAAALRCALHLTARRAFAPEGPRTLRLVYHRDLLSLAIWVASRFGRTVDWRREPHDLGPHGSLRAS